MSTSTSGSEYLVTRESRREIPHKRLTAAFRTGTDGREYWRSIEPGTGKQFGVCVHQLVAIADGAPPEKVFSNGKYCVYHRNKIPWDNRSENLLFRRRGLRLRKPKAQFETKRTGYERWTTKTPDGEQHSIYVHQLVAIADGAPPEKVFSEGEYHVHHRNNIPWDNRPENLELLDGREHLSRHSAERAAEA